MVAEVLVVVMTVVVAGLASVRAAILAAVTV